MAKGSDYRIKKIEKGPLQRFKNQNLLIKKYGEIGLQIYKAITGKRSTQELRKDLGIDQNLFDQVLTYMQDAGMVELEPASGEPKPAAEEEAPEAPAPEEAREEEKPSRKLEEIPPEEEIGPAEEPPPLEEKPVEKPKGKGKAKPREEEITLEAPEAKEEIELEEKPAPKKKAAEEEITFEEIKPIEFGEEFEETPYEKKAKKKAAEEAGEPEIGEEIKPVSEEPPPEEEEAPPRREEIEEEKPSPPEEEISPLEREEKFEEESGLSPVEKIISDKYGDIGLRVYALIDGQRTAEEIMRETGLTEPKLVEILDFMDEQGIIKLDYPKGGGAGAGPGGPAGGMAPPPQSFMGGGQMAQPQMGAAAQKREEGGFNPLTESDESLDEAKAVPSPVEVPLKAPMDLVKGVQMKAKLMLKFKENKGGKILDMVDGKNDIIDMSLKLDIPLYEVTDILRFMMENGMIIMKPVSRSDVRKKYGDDGYSVYKKFGKEGLMLYELIGKELTIKQMADKITTDKAKIIDMFIFIHKVLGIELPIDRDVLSKQLGL